MAVGGKKCFIVRYQTTMSQVKHKRFSYLKKKNSSFSLFCFGHPTLFLFVIWPYLLRTHYTRIIYLEEICKAEDTLKVSSRFQSIRTLQSSKNPYIASSCLSKKQDRSVFFFLFWCSSFYSLVNKNGLCNKESLHTK